MQLDWLAEEFNNEAAIPALIVMLFCTAGSDIQVKFSPETVLFYLTQC